MIKPFKETEKICNDQKGVFKQDKYYKIGGKKFRIKFEHSNGSPIGFNSKKCIQGFDDIHIKWNSLHDVSEVDIGMKCPSYYSSECEEYMKYYFAAMEKFIEELYS